LKIMITGATGMVGQAVSKHVEARGDALFSFSHQDLDIADSEQVLRTFAEVQPELVINCAAWTDVDGCESDPERAELVNSRGPENLALASRRLGAAFISLSTDYVFDGEKAGFYTQRDTPNPQSIYATSKLEGERRAQLAHAGTIVVRTGFVFGEGGKNFLSTIVSRVRAGQALSAISDAYGCPTYSRDLAVRLRELGVLNLPGIYHVVNDGGGASFEQFALEALSVAGCDQKSITPISFSSLNRPAARPRNSRLRCLLSSAIGLAPLRSWQDAVRDFVEQQSEAGSVGATQQAIK
jgi:dTDP-4-dehydrorhamnose reductase